jgi:YVTN family beta-propeller protein
VTVKTAVLAAAMMSTALTPAAAQRAYIPNSAADTVSVINVPTSAVIATIPVGVGPMGVAVDPPRGRVYVANSNSVSVIDGVNNTVIGTITTGGILFGIAVSPDGTKVYTANMDHSLNNPAGDSSSVFILDTASLTKTGFVTTGAQPLGVAAHPTNGLVYVGNYIGGTIAAVDPVAKTKTVIEIDCSPYGLAVNAEGTLVYAACQAQEGNELVVINTATNAIVAALPLGAGAVGVALSPNTNRVYVVDRDDDVVLVFDTNTRALIATIAVGDRPVGVAVTEDGSRVYVANQTSDTVSVINGATNAVIATIPVGDQPWSFGKFILPAPLTFAGTPGRASCLMQSSMALQQKYGGQNRAAAALGFGFGALQKLHTAIVNYCGG